MVVLSSFKYLASKFQRLTEAKLKEVLFSVLALVNSRKTKSLKQKWKTVRDQVSPKI